jgi:hypothetical protein
MYKKDAGRNNLPRNKGSPELSTERSTDRAKTRHTVKDKFTEINTKDEFDTYICYIYSGWGPHKIF